eukprot:m.104426 g.104426  ORF g.104426 m.104426 type:complete len:359 (+) comp15756_c0_seq2:38-1114(+)
MSHQSGIGGTPELTAAFAEAYNSTDTRLIKVVIENERLVPVNIVRAKGTWEEDYDGAVLGNVEEEMPCYLFYRLDSRNSSGFDFVFIAWAPDFSHVRSKMLYASTRSTLKTIFGGIYIKAELFGTVRVDVSLAGYHKHLAAEAAPAPLTNAEIEKAEIRAAETGVNIGVSTKKAIATGVQFPLAPDAEAALEKFKSGAINYLQLKLNLQTEVIESAIAETTDAHSIAAKIPNNSARYSVFNFKHNHEGDNMNSIVFVYSCPGYQIPVKERMLYSSCKGPLIDLLTSSGVVLAKNIEISDGAEFTHDWLYEQIHPAKTVFKAKFDRPKKPGKGGRRIVRSTSGSTAGAGEEEEAEGGDE